jgi:transcriptional regulator of acetoin/glycerol metabolism
MVESGKFRADSTTGWVASNSTCRAARQARRHSRCFVDHFFAMQRRRVRLTVSSAVYEALLSYSWPGNVRQLARVLERVGRARRWARS